MSTGMPAKAGVGPPAAHRGSLWACHPPCSPAALSAPPRAPPRLCAVRPSELPPLCAPACLPAVESIDADLFGSTIPGGGFQPSDENRHRCVGRGDVGRRGGERRPAQEVERPPPCPALLWHASRPACSTGLPALALAFARATTIDPQPSITAPGPADPSRRMRVAMHSLLIDAYNANLADLEARRDALAAGAEALIKRELVTGGWLVGGRAGGWFWVTAWELVRAAGCLSRLGGWVQVRRSQGQGVRSRAELRAWAPPGRAAPAAPGAGPAARECNPWHCSGTPWGAGEELDAILEAHPPVQPAAVRRVEPEPLDTLLPA